LPRVDVAGAAGRGIDRQVTPGRHRDGPERGRPRAVDLLNPRSGIGVIGRVDDAILDNPDYDGDPIDQVVDLDPVTGLLRELFQMTRPGRPFGLPAVSVAGVRGRPRLEGENEHSMAAIRLPSD
jgi:hypothetical protein